MQTNPMTRKGHQMKDLGRHPPKMWQLTSAQAGKMLGSSDIFDVFTTGDGNGIKQDSRKGCLATTACLAVCFHISMFTHQTWKRLVKAGSYHHLFGSASAFHWGQTCRFCTFAQSIPVDLMSSMISLDAGDVSHVRYLCYVSSFFLSAKLQAK